MKRKHRNRKERARLFTLHGGICHICKGKILAFEGYELEHIIPFAVSHDDSDENVKPVHAKCHKRKTTDDAQYIAKTERMKAKHEGHFPKTRGNARLQSRGFQNTRG